MIATGQMRDVRPCPRCGAATGSACRTPTCPQLRPVPFLSAEEFQSNSEPKRTLSDFIRNATPTERQEVYEGVIDRSIERQRHQVGTNVATAAAALVKAMDDRHYGRMPDEVQTAFDALKAELRTVAGKKS